MDISLISLIVGISSIVLAVLSLICILLVRSSIAELLSRNNILFDKNFEIKEQAIAEAMSLCDDALNYGPAVSSSQEYRKNAEKVYNELLCVLTNANIAEEFRTITLSNQPATLDKVFNFKLLCRSDIGFSVRDMKNLRKHLPTQNVQYAQPQMQQPQQVQPQMQQSQQIQQPAVQYNQPAQPRPAVQRPTQPVQRPTAQPTTTPNSQPVQPQRRVVARPTQTPKN